LREIHGPFSRDPNIRSVLVHFDDFVWVLHRPALDAERPDQEIGSVELRDVRAYRLRPLSSADTGLYDSFVAPWAVELDSSEYLLEEVRRDPQRSVSSLSSHRHFLVPDGNAHVIDVIARSVATGTLDMPRLDLRRLFLDEPSIG
jgi:hypothetical protein